MNLNKVVPRLTIRVKLLIAFVGVALGPLAILTMVTTLGSVRQLQTSTAIALRNDVELAHQSVTREIRQAEQHLSFLVEAVLADFLRGDDPTAFERSHGVTSTFLEVDSSAVFRIKVLNPLAMRVFYESRIPFDHADPRVPYEEPYYLWSVENSPDGESVIFPIEIRLDTESSELQVIPAIAIVQAIRNPEGALLGVAVAEVEASILFEGLLRDLGFGESTTGLVDQEGQYLFHSSQKSHWSSLYASASEGRLGSEFNATESSMVTSGIAGSFRAEDGRLVSYRPIRFGGAREARLTLYRSIDASVVNRPVWTFLSVTLGVGVVVLLTVFGAAFLAAEQFTFPILRLRAAVAELEAGNRPSISIPASNDEFEDLANDFRRMARELARQRAQLVGRVKVESRKRERMEAHLDEVVTHAADAIIGLGRQGTIRLWNRGAERLFCYAEDEAVGRSLSELIGSLDSESKNEQDFIDRSIANHDGVVGLRTVRRAADGTRIPVSLTQTAIRDESGAYIGASLIIRDARAQQEFEEQMRRSERLAAISIMAAGLAHELNNPLAVLGNRVELIERDAKNGIDPDRLRKDLAVIRQHVARVRAVTTDLLNFAREDAQEDQVDLVEVVQRVTRLLSHSIAAAGVTLRVEVPDKWLPVRGYEKAIETVLSNLLINAIQATGDGGIVVVGVELTPGGDFVEMRVSDSGPGVPSELRDRIFEPFFTTKGAKGGTGLGLAVCRAVMERHGGSLALHSIPTGGTCFLTSFPAETTVYKSQK